MIVQTGTCMTGDMIQLRGAMASSPAPWTREMRRSDCSSIRRLLHFLPDLYPGADEWLERRLSDVGMGKAYCSVAGVERTLGGILIETPKGRRAAKVSTFYVHPRICCFGLGSLLFARHEDRWLRCGIDDVHITVPQERLNPLSAFLIRRGFTPAAKILEKYRRGSFETVLTASVH